MIDQLQGPHRDPFSGEGAQSLVIMLHGLGASGDDLIGLADALSPIFPRTGFYSPNAPDQFTEADFGFQWFPRGLNDIERLEATRRSEGLVNTYIDRLLSQHQLESSRCVLMGFSQGTIMSMHLAPRRASQLAGVVGFSGMMTTGDTLPEEITSWPPFTLIHGTQDLVLSASESQNAAQALNALNIPVDLHLLSGLGHGIDDRGLRIAADFIARVLPTDV